MTTACLYCKGEGEHATGCPFGEPIPLPWTLRLGIWCDDHVGRIYLVLILVVVLMWLFA